MSVTYTQLNFGGPAYGAFNSLNIQFVDDVTATTEQITDPFETSLRGAVDEVRRDMIVKITGRPRFYDTAQLAMMFPWIAGVPGTLNPGSYVSSTALPFVLYSNNLDVLTVASCLVGKMPDIELGVSGPMLGPIEFWGVIPYGVDATTANAYYTSSTAGSFTQPAVPSTALIGEAEYWATWTGVTGFTTFQAQDKWTISHELKLGPVVIQGRTRAFKLESYRVMAKCKPLGPTAAQIDAALNAQGTGAGGGSLLSSANAANLVIGTVSGTPPTGSPLVTIGTAALKTAGYQFSNKAQALRYGELGWVSTYTYADTNGGSTKQPLTLA